MKKLVALFFSLLFVCSAAFAAVDLNTADADQLQTLNGIGPAKAKAIIDYRTQNGPFKIVDDLKKVSGFGDKTLEKLRKDLVVTPADAAPAAKPSVTGKAAAPVKAKKDASRPTVKK